MSVQMDRTMKDMIFIDGSKGEGGGQILRSALSLSAITNTPLTIENIRAARKKPGLMRQHLTAARAVARVCNGQLQGDELGSQQLTLLPGEVTAGYYEFSISTAGSACLVAQTVLPVLLAVPQPSKLRFTGGTHNPMAPPFDFFQQSFLPMLKNMGLEFEAELQQYGFYPAGGGAFTLAITPPERLKPLHMLERGPLHGHKVEAVVAHLSSNIAAREVGTICKKLAWPKSCTHITSIGKPGEGAIGSNGPGNMVAASIQHQYGYEMVVGFGERGLSAERVAKRVAGQMRRYIDSEAVVGEYLADQLLLPLALAGGGGFTTTEPSQHTLSNIAVIEQFLPVRFACEKLTEKCWQVSLS